MVPINFTKQPIPYFLYKRIRLNHYREYFVFRIPYGYGYFLRRFAYKYPEFSGSSFCPPLSFEFFDKAANHSRQLEPITGENLSSPGCAGKVQSSAAPAAVDQNIFGLNFTATQPKFSKTLNYFFPNNDTLEIHITGQDLTLPGYVDIMLQGFYIADDTAILNRGL